MILRWLAGLLLTAVAGLLVVLWLLTGTEAGARWLASQAEMLSAGVVHFEGLGGTLRGGLHADTLVVRTGELQVQVEGFELVIRPEGLLGGELWIWRLAASRVLVDVGPPGSDAPFIMPTLRAALPMRVREIVVPQLELRRGTAAWTLTSLRFAGELRGSELAIDAARAGYAGFVVELGGSAELRPPLPLDLRVTWSLAGPQWSGAGTARGDLDEMVVAQTLRLPESATVHVSLHDLAGTPHVEAELRWPVLTRELPGVGRVEARTGQARLVGSLARWQATLATELGGGLLPPLTTTVRLQGDSQRVVVEEAQATGGFGSVAAHGSVDLATGDAGGGAELRLDIIASDIDTAAFRPGLDGRLSGRLHLVAAPDAPLRIDVARLQGRLMGRPLVGSGALTWLDGTLGFNQLELRAGANRLRADGSIGERLAGRFEFVAPDLAVLWPGLSGALSGRATLAGTRMRPVIDAAATIRALAFDDSQLAQAELHLQVDRSQRVDARWVARDLRTGGRQLGNLHAHASGTLDAHHLQAELQGGLVTAMLTSDGRWDGALLHHRLAAATISNDAIGAWQLAGEPELVLGTTQAAISGHCWEQTPTSVCISEARWTPRASALALELRWLNLARFNRWLGGELAVTGRADASLAVSLSARGITGSARWHQQGTTLYYTGGDEPLITSLPAVEADAELGADSGHARLDIRGEEGQRLSGELHMQAPPGLDAPIVARLSGAWPDIAPLVPFLAGDLDVADLAGHVMLEVAASGSLHAPRLVGALRLQEGSLALPDLGVKLEAINLAFIGDGGEVLRLDGSATAGGQLAIDGELQPLAAGGPRGWMRMRGNRLDAVRLPDRQVQVSPDLRLDYAPGAITASGRLVIPQAAIVMRELPASAASPSADAVVRDRPPRAADAAISTTIGGEVAIELGRQVHFKGFGLDTLLEGNLALSQAPDRAPQGFGVLHLKEGRFGAYGKELVIERGTLGFSGPLDDPAVDIRATRHVEYEGRNITAGIRLSGTASRPQSQVFSEPAMSQADAISYLITGHPLQGGSEKDQSAVAGAALALGVQQTSPITQAIGNAVTLDELGVEAGSVETAQVVAGKHLGSDLYVRFSYGLFNRIGTVLARYRLNRNLSIEASSGEDQSLDLVYSVERD